LVVFMAVHETETAFHDATARRDAMRKEVLDLIADFLVMLEHRFGRTNRVIEDFGYRLHKPASDPTANAKGARTQKGRRTRGERRRARRRKDDDSTSLET